MMGAVALGVVGCGPVARGPVPLGPPLVGGVVRIDCGLAVAVVPYPDDVTASRLGTMFGGRPWLGPGRREMRLGTDAVVDRRTVRPGALNEVGSMAAPARLPVPQAFVVAPRVRQHRSGAEPHPPSPVSARRVAPDWPARTVHGWFLRLWVGQGPPWPVSRLRRSPTGAGGGCGVQSAAPTPRRRGGLGGPSRQRISTRCWAVRWLATPPSATPGSVVIGVGVRRPDRRDVAVPGLAVRPLAAPGLVVRRLAVPG